MEYTYFSKINTLNNRSPFIPREVQKQIDVPLHSEKIMHTQTPLCIKSITFISKFQTNCNIYVCVNKRICHIHLFLSVNTNYFLILQKEKLDDHSKYHIQMKIYMIMTYIYINIYTPNTYIDHGIHQIHKSLSQANIPVINGSLSKFQTKYKSKLTLNSFPK